MKMSANPSIVEPSAPGPGALSQRSNTFDQVLNGPSSASVTVYEALAQAVSSAMGDAVARFQSAGEIRNAAVSAACSKLLAMQPADAPGRASTAAAQDSLIPVGPAPSTPPDTVTEEVVRGRSSLDGSTPAGDSGLPEARGPAPVDVVVAQSVDKDALPTKDEMATILDICNQLQMATMSPQVVLTSGAGKAYQVVALATALAVLDSMEAARCAGTLMTTAVGVALAHHLATGDQRTLDAIAQASKLLDTALAQFKQTGDQAAAVLKGFPAG
jgi:hypothetical protein